MRGTTAIVLAVLAVACSERRAEEKPPESGGTLVIVTTQDPGTLFPPYIETGPAKQIAEQIYDYLADVGTGFDARDEKTYRRELAKGWRWSSDSTSIAFQLDSRARWHDGRNVTAGDVRFTFALNKNPAVASRYQSSLGNIDSVTVQDSLTPVFWFHRRQPSQFLDAAAQLLILPEHQLGKIPPEHLRERVPPPVGSGRFRLRRWEKGATVEIVADTANYRGRAILNRVIWSVTPDFNAAFARLMGGEADLFDGLRPENVQQLARRRTLRAITLPGMAYAFLRFNLRDPADTTHPHPLFGDRNLRRALTMSLDRKAMVRSVFDTLARVPVGPTVRAYPTTDTALTQFPFDSVRGGRLLDSLGWTRGANGVRAKNGRHLSFNVLVPTSSLNRQRVSVLLQAQLRKMGVLVNTERIETTAQTARLEKGEFDASLDSWIMYASPDGTRDAWTTSGIGRNGVNYGFYSSPRFDALLDSALASEPAAARKRFTAAYEVINEDAPAIWLYEPLTVIGVHRRFRTTGMRADSWWFSLADWYVPPTERILRDRIPASR
jgi:peptide/nickel transport system substrate-binding protein